MNSRSASMRWKLSGIPSQNGCSYTDQPQHKNHLLNIVWVSLMWPKLLWPVKAWGGGVLRECSYHEGAYLVHNGVWMHWVCQVASTGMPRPKVSRQNVALLREGQCYWYHLSVALMLWLIDVDAMLWNIISNCFPLILLECSPFYFRVLFFWVLLAWLAERRSAER